MVRETAKLRATAEERYADELARLAGADEAPRPAGWRLSARAVRRFILGDASSACRGSSTATTLWSTGRSSA